MNIFKRLASSLFANSAHNKASTAPPLDLDEINVDWLVVGLGNPGKKYAATRHNVGYMAVDDMLAETGSTLRPIAGANAFGAVLDCGEHTALALRCDSYMNVSGEVIAPIAQALGLGAERVLVLHDELDLAEHKVRIKQGGNENGHNGLKSTTERLGTRDYVRVRMGIGRPAKGKSIVEYVLAPIDSGAGFDDFIATAAKAAYLVVSSGVGAAQNTIHARN